LVVPAENPLDKVDEESSDDEDTYRKSKARAVHVYDEGTQPEKSESPLPQVASEDLETSKIPGVAVAEITEDTAPVVQRRPKKFRVKDSKVLIERSSMEPHELDEKHKKVDDERNLFTIYYDKMLLWVHGMSELYSEVQGVEVLKASALRQEKKWNVRIWLLIIGLVRAYFAHIDFALFFMIYMNQVGFPPVVCCLLSLKHNVFLHP